MTQNLQKGEEIVLDKSNSQLIIGLGWAQNKRKGVFGEIKARDLDASCIMLGKRKEMLDLVYYEKLVSNDQAVVHSGDNQTGAAKGDAEQISIDLNKIDSEVQNIFFIITSFGGQTFEQIEKAYFRIVQTSDDKEIFRYSLYGGGKNNALIMLKFIRTAEGWTVKALGEPATGTTPYTMLPSLVPFID